MSASGQPAHALSPAVLPERASQRHMSSLVAAACGASGTICAWCAQISNIYVHADLSCLALCRDTATGSVLADYKESACPPNGLAALGPDCFLAAQANVPAVHTYAWDQASTAVLLSCSCHTTVHTAVCTYAGE